MTALASVERLDTVYRTTEIPQWVKEVREGRKNKSRVIPGSLRYSYRGAFTAVKPRKSVSGMVP